MTDVREGLKFMKDGSPIVWSVFYKVLLLSECVAPAVTVSCMISKNYIEEVEMRGTQELTAIVPSAHW